MISRLAVLLVLVQSNAQVLKTYRSAEDHFEKGDYAETIRICSELVKQREKVEGTIRARLGAGFEDKAFQPRRLAGDAAMKRARNTAGLEEKLAHVKTAIVWYKASVGLKFEKSRALLAAAEKEKTRIEGEINRVSGAALLRKKMDTLRASVNEKLAAQAFEEARTVLARAKAEFGKEAAWKALNSDVESAFAVWHNGIRAELRRDLAAFKAPDVLRDPAPLIARFARYRVPVSRASAERLDPALGWAVRLAEAAGKRPAPVEAVERLATEGLKYGPAHWTLAAGIVLEARAAGVKDPGAPASLEERWKAVLDAEGTFAGAAGRARAAVEEAAKTAEGVRKADLDRWLREDLAAFERRVAQIRRSLPDRDAPKAVDAAIARLRDPAILSEGRRDGYGAVESELQEILTRSRLDPVLRSRLLAGLAVARAHALFLDGLSREQVLEKCRTAVRDAVKGNPAAFEAWKKNLSPRIGWVLEEAGR